MISPIFFILGMLHPPMELFTGEEYWGPRVPRGGSCGGAKIWGWPKRSYLPRSSVERRNKCMMSR